nr:C80 family cysteine peptidase [uncultured Pseudomonas sp.]
MATMSSEFTEVFNALIQKQLQTKGKSSEWFSMSAAEQAQYIAEVNERLIEMQQSTLSVLAAQYYEMQANPVSIDEHLQVLKYNLGELNGQPETETSRNYKRQLEIDIGLYTRQKTGMSSFEKAWKEAVALVQPGDPAALDTNVMLDDAAAKQRLLQSHVGRLQDQMNAQAKSDNFSEAYVAKFAELQAYKHVEQRYGALVSAEPADKPAKLDAMSQLPKASDESPVNASLLLMEERPGYIRMNVALVNASYGGQFKDMFIENGQLVLPKDSMLNFSFGTTARSLAWQEQYRLKTEIAVSPTFTPIRSVLMKTEFVEKYFGHYMVSESNMRNGFNVQPLEDGSGMKLTSVDRKIPNQIGIAVGEIKPPEKKQTTETLKVKPADLARLINQYADIASFQTIALEGFRQTFYTPERDGAFVNVSDLEKSIGFSDRLYLLERETGGDFFAATPFMTVSKEKSGKLTSTLLSKAETSELYEYNLSFFEKLEALRDGTLANSTWYHDTIQRADFEAQLVRLLDRNHMTPAVITPAGEDIANVRRDVKGNNMNKVLWERDFANTVWQSTEADNILFELGRKMVPMLRDGVLDRLRKNGYMESDLALAKKLMPGLYEYFRGEAQASEAKRVSDMNAARDPRNKSPLAQVIPEQIEVLAVNGLIKSLLNGAPTSAINDVALSIAVESALQGASGKLLRKQILFHAVRTVAENAEVSSNEATHPHMAMEGDDGLEVTINNRLQQPDPYLILNAKFEELEYRDGGYVIKDDKYQSYSQFIADENKRSTQYMRDLDTPFVGGISGTTKMVTKALSGASLFGRPLTPKEYWQFQMANAAFMIRNGYHSFFETIYVAVRFEPAGSRVGQQLLPILDRYRSLGAGTQLQGSVYEDVMKLVLPVINEGVPPAEQFKAPSFDRFGPLLQPLAGESTPYRTLREKIDLVAQVYERLTRELRLDEQVLTPGFKQMSQAELDNLDLSASKTDLAQQLDKILDHQRRQGHSVPASLSAEEKETIVRLAVEGIVKQDFNQRGELLIYLDSLGFSFKPKGNADRLLTFWSDERLGYEGILNNALQAAGRPGIAIDFDVTALDFVHGLRTSISNHAQSGPGGAYSPLALAAKAGSLTVAGFLSSVYAASTADQGGTVYAMSKGGLKIHNYFWNAELPVLRALQTAGVLGELRILNEPFDNYTGMALKDIGSSLSDRAVKVLVRPEYLPDDFANKLMAADYRRWVKEGPRTQLIALHNEIDGYIALHKGSGRNPAMESLRDQIITKLEELYAINSLENSELIVKASANLLGESVLWTRSELVEAAKVSGKRQGESYVRIQHLLDQWHDSSKGAAFVFAGHRDKPYVEMRFKGDVIDNYLDVKESTAHFGLLGSSWNVEVDTSAFASGTVTLKNRVGTVTVVSFDPASNAQQTRAQLRQASALQRFLLANFNSETMPADVQVQGNQIVSNGSTGAAPKVLANFVSSETGWVTDTSAVEAVRRTSPTFSSPEPTVGLLNNQQVNNWAVPVVQGNPGGGDSQYSAQIIIQSESDPVVGKAAASLAGKHPGKSLVMQLDASGQTRLVYGDPAVFQALGANAKVRWQIVGHGRGAADARTLGGLNASQWAQQLDRFQHGLNEQYGIGSAPTRISLVGCSLEEIEQQNGFGRQLVVALQTPDLEISVRSADVAVDSKGRKFTLDKAGEWVHSAETDKLVLKWSKTGGVVDTYEHLPAGILLGRDGIDVLTLLDDLQHGRVLPEQLGAAQEYALSRLFPGADERLNLEAMRRVLDNPLTFAQLQDSLELLPKTYSSSVELESLGAEQLLERMLETQEQNLRTDAGLTPENEKLTNAMLDNVLGTDADRVRPFSYLDNDSHVSRLRAANRQALSEAGNVTFSGPDTNAFGSPIAAVQHSLSAVLLHDMGLLVEGKPLTVALLNSQGGKLLATQKLSFDPTLFSYEMSKVPLHPELVSLAVLINAQIKLNGGSYIDLFAKGGDVMTALNFIRVFRNTSAAQLDPEIAKVVKTILGERAGERAQWLAESGSLSVDERRRVQNLYELARDVSGFDLAQYKKLQGANPNVSGDQILQQMALDAAQKRIAPGQDTEVVMQAARWTEQEARQFLIERKLLGNGAGTVSVDPATFSRFIDTASGIDRIRLASAMLKLSSEQHLAIKRDLEGASSERLRSFVADVDQQRAKRPSMLADASDKFGTALDVFETLNSVRDMVANWSHIGTTDKALNLTGLIGGVAMSPLSAAIARAVSAAGKALGAVSSFSKAATVIRGGILDAALAPVTFAGIGLQWQSFWSGNGDTNSYEYKSLVANTVITTVTTAVSLALTGVSIAASLSSAVAASVLGTLAASAGPIGVAIAAAGFIINGVVQGAMQLAEFGDYFASTADQVAQFFAAWVGVETDALKRARVEKQAVGAANELRNTLNSDWEKTKNYLSDLFAKDKYGYLNYRDRDNKVAHGTLKSGEDFSYALQQQIVYGEIASKDTQFANDGGEVWMELGNQHPSYVATGKDDKRNLFNLGGQSLQSAAGGTLSDAFNLDADTRITSIDAKNLSAQQKQQGLNENDSLMLNAGGLDVKLDSRADGAMDLVYQGTRVAMDGLQHRSGDRGSIQTASPAVTRQVNQQLRVAGVESYIIREVGTADIKGSGRQEFFDVSGTEVKIAGGGGEGNVYSVNKGNRILSSSNDTLLWSGVNASITLQGARNAAGELLASQTLQVSLSSRYNQIKVRRNGNLLELKDGQGVLSLSGLYTTEGAADNGKVLQLLDVNKYTFSLPGLGLIDDQWRSLESMAKTFVFTADAQRAGQFLSNDHAVNTYALKAGAGSFRAALHTNQLMQFMLEAPLASLSYSLAGDTLTIRSSDSAKPLQLSIEGYKAALDGQLIKIWLQDEENGSYRMQEVSLPAANDSVGQPLAVVDSRQVQVQIDKAMVGMLKTHGALPAQALDLTSIDAIYAVNASNIPEVSLRLANAASRDKLKQVRVGDDLLVFDMERVRPGGLLESPHLRIRQYFTQQPAVSLKLSVAGVNSPLAVALSHYAGDMRDETLDATQATSLSGGNGGDRYRVNVSGEASRLTLDNMAQDGKLDILELQGNVSLDRLGLRAVGNDLELLVFDTAAAARVRVAGGYGTPAKTIVLKNYVVDGQARHLQLQLQDQLYRLPEVDQQSGYFVHLAQAGSAVLGLGVHALQVSPFAARKSQVIALDRPLTDFQTEVAGLGYDLKLAKDGQTFFVRDYYRNPEAVQFSWFDTTQSGMKLHSETIFPANFHSAELALYTELEVPKVNWMAYINNNIVRREDVQAYLKIETGARAADFLTMPGSQNFSVYARVRPAANGEQMLFGTGSSSSQGFQVVIDSSGRLGFRSFSKSSKRAGNTIQQVDFGGFHSPAIGQTVLDLTGGELVIQFKDDRFIEVYGPGNGSPILLGTYDMGTNFPDTDGDGFKAPTLTATRNLSSEVRSYLNVPPKVLNGLASAAQMNTIFTNDGDNWGVMSEQAKTYLRIKGLPEGIVGELAMWNVLTQANLEKVVDLHQRGQGQLSARFIIDYVLDGRSWILKREHAVYAMELENLGGNSAFITNAFNYGLSVDEVRAYTGAQSAGWPGKDRLLNFALALRGDDSNYLDGELKTIRNSNGIGSDNRAKFYFRPSNAEDTLVLKSALVHKGYLPARAEQLAQRLVEISSLDYQRVESLLNAGIGDDALLKRLVAAGVNGEDVKFANAERLHYENGKRSELIEVSSSSDLSQFSPRTQTQFYSRQYLRIDGEGNVHQLGSQPYDLNSFNQARQLMGQGTFSSIEQVLASSLAASFKDNYRHTFAPGQILGADGRTLTTQELGKGQTDGAYYLWEQGHIDRADRILESQQSWFGRSTPANLVDGFDRVGEAFAWRGASNMGFDDQASNVADITFVSGANTPDMEDKASYLRFDLKHKVALASLTLHTANSVAQEGQADTTRNGVYRVEALQSNNQWRAVSDNLNWTGQQDVMNVAIDTQGVPYQHYRLRGVSGSYDRDRLIKEVTFTTVAVPQALESTGQLAKLSGAMATFPDTGGPRLHVSQSREMSQVALVPSVS